MFLHSNSVSNITYMTSADSASNLHCSRLPNGSEFPFAICLTFWAASYILGDISNISTVNPSCEMVVGEVTIFIASAGNRFSLAVFAQVVECYQQLYVNL